MSRNIKTGHADAVLDGDLDRSNQSYLMEGEEG